MMDTPVLLGSITDVSEADRGAVAVSGSHGGLYPAAIASQAGLRAVIFNDAGVGFESAGVEGALALAKVGMAAASADCMTCWIGSAEDAFANGRISVANEVALACGVEVGMSVSAAATLLATAPVPHGVWPKQEEARFDWRAASNSAAALCVDSASLVRAEDHGRIIVTGSHGALIGGDPSRALKTEASVAVFNDAGLGKDRIGASRLDALAERGVAAATVAHSTCKIGDARSALKTGVISDANQQARELGAEVGGGLAPWLRSLLA